MAEQLRPEGIPVAVGDVVITTPGLIGQVEVLAPGTEGMRGEEQATEEFQQALADAGMAEQLSVVVSQHQEVTPGDGTRGSGGGDDIVVNVPAPGEGNGQVLLYAAEDGSLSWHLADDVPPDDRARPRRRAADVPHPASRRPGRRARARRDPRCRWAPSARRSSRSSSSRSSTRSSARSATTSPSAGRPRTG